MAHMGVAVDHQPLDLMEHRRMGLVGVAAIGAAGADDADRRRVLSAWCAPAPARCGCAATCALPSAPRLKKKVSCISRAGMAGREIQLGEVLDVVLDIRTLGDGEAHVAEDGDDLVHHLADRMDAAVSSAAARAGRVTSTVSAARRASSAASFRTVFRPASASPTRSFSALIFAPSVLRSSGAFCPASPAARISSLSCRGRLHARIRGRLVAGAFDRGEGLGFELGEIGHRRKVRRRNRESPRVLPCAGVRDNEAVETKQKSPPKGAGFCQTVREPQAAAVASAAGRAALAFSTIALKAAGSAMASSDRTLRSTSTPDLARPSMKRE